MKLFPSVEGQEADVVLIGAGIMSATLGSLLKILEPGLKIRIFEMQDTVATESSDAWNNAGTGHSAYCELNYTPEKEDGTIDTKKAVNIAEAFQLSRQFWASLVTSGFIDGKEKFIHDVPHVSFVWGAEQVTFLRKRHQALSKHPLFAAMEYSEDPEVIKQWVPLIMEGRELSEPVAATRMMEGTDVNFGALTRMLFTKMESMPDVKLSLNTEVKDLSKDSSGLWNIKIRCRASGEQTRLRAKFVFIGAGGGALPLLLKSGIEEAKGFGGFPVGGQWLVCNNEDIVKQHEAKVYGLAEIGAPPMSVPHLDTRVIDGKKALLFGPYAGFSTKFLKRGSFLDLFLSLRPSNIIPMLGAGLHNLSLTRYLIEQVLQSDKERINNLRKYYPQANAADWKLAIAGQRVQVIKKDEKEGGKLEFGTEVVKAQDGSVAALLGASPGASTSVSIMLNLLAACFPESYHEQSWQQTLKKLIPSLGVQLDKDPAMFDEIRQNTAQALNLQQPVKADVLKFGT